MLSAGRDVSRGIYKESKRGGKRVKGGNVRSFKDADELDAFLESLKEE